MPLSRPKVVLLGNHDVGCRTLQTLCEIADVLGVITHPPDPEEGTRYASLYESAATRGLRVQRARGADPALRTFLELCRPDLLLVADFRYILPPALLELARFGGINLHPSLLPKYRGRAPVNWAILRGERELGLTAHVITAAVDAGPIVAQRRFQLGLHEDVADALAKLLPLYDELTRIAVERARRRDLVGTPQSETDATTFPRRTAQDGALDFNQPATAVFNLIRAVAHPYPGAFATLTDGRLVHVWKARLAGDAERLHWQHATPGRYCGNAHDGPLIRCGAGAIVVRSATLQEQSAPWIPTPGAQFCVAAPTPALGAPA